MRETRGDQIRAINGTGDIWNSVRIQPTLIENIELEEAELQSGEGGQAAGNFPSRQAKTESFSNARQA